MESRTILPPDHHGRLPRMHYDALHTPSPTTRSDLIAWCIGQREAHGVSATLRDTMMTTMTAVMKKKASTTRLGDLPAALLIAIEKAADDLHAIVREFGYDPTRVNDFRNSCLAIIMERIAPITHDLSYDGDSLADQPASRDGLHQVISIAAIGTTLAAALTGKTSAERMLDSLVLAFEETDVPAIKDVLADAVVKLKDAIDRKHEG